ncbi:hypothetical protein LO772_29605 [Yinghuangia sp. ASG 101]|uniref:hypothetical protein n=1 Tax=Yinghuangia sp. ASG 101 TaxID=2896848 RepID=UPI001E36B88D|nr:hypothetical protein [Yinghuangia sp. ASG 101]UGQ10928.1 hypothetical protein LO772_29605 [Yinghuangia sp. ASG 101]
MPRETLRTRLALGWDAEHALTQAKHDNPPLHYTHNGRTLTLRGWAEQSGIKYHTLYSRINKSGMTFAEALDKGPDGPNFSVPVTAFGETKPVHRWAVDPRANCNATTMRRRLTQGWPPEQAITEEPNHRHALGTGTPHNAYGRRMGLEDWARHTHIPANVIRKRMEHHQLTLEVALHSLGWTPTAHDGPPPPALVETTAEHLQPGDHILAVDHTPDTETVAVTVRRPPTPAAQERRATTRASAAPPPIQATRPTRSR